MEWAQNEWQPPWGSVCVYIQCCWLWAYTESALCFRLEFFIEWAVLCVCPVELLEEPASLTASGDAAGRSRLLDWTPWYCALRGIYALSHCCPEWGDVSRAIILYQFLGIFWYVLVKLQEARLAITMLNNSFVSPEKDRMFISIWTPNIPAWTCVSLTKHLLLHKAHHRISQSQRRKCSLPDLRMSHWRKASKWSQEVCGLDSPCGFPFSIFVTSVFFLKKQFWRFIYLNFMHVSIFPACIYT